MSCWLIADAPYLFLLRPCWEFLEFFQVVSLVGVYISGIHDAVTSLVTHENNGVPGLLFKVLTNDSEVE